MLEFELRNDVMLKLCDYEILCFFAVLGLRSFPFLVISNCQDASVKLATQLNP